MGPSGPNTYLFILQAILVGAAVASLLVGLDRRRWVETRGIIENVPPVPSGRYATRLAVSVTWPDGHESSTTIDWAEEVPPPRPGTAIPLWIDPRDPRRVIHAPPGTLSLCVILPGLAAVLLVVLTVRLG